MISQIKNTVLLYY